MRQKKKPVTLDEYLASRVSKKDIYEEKYKRSLAEARGDNDLEMKLIEDENINIGKYSLRTRIRNNPWLKKGRPATEAIKWFYRDVLKNPQKYRYRQNLMFSGGLYTFEYFNPKYKGTEKLPWFDKYPLVLSLGPVTTKLGVRNIGFNLHIVPPKVRIVLMCIVFEMYKRLYRYQIFFKRTRPVQIRYENIMKATKKYGAAFCVRMYIPARQKQVCLFPYSDWYKAVFLPSRGYDSIKAAKLIQEWQKFVRKLGYATSPNLNWSSHI